MDLDGFSWFSHQTWSGMGGTMGIERDTQPTICEHFGVCVWIGYTPCDSNLGLPILDNPHSNIWQLAHHNIGYQNQTTQIWGVPHFVPDQERILWILRKTPGRRHSITIQILDLGNLIYIQLYNYIYIHRVIATTKQPAQLCLRGIMARLCWGGELAEARARIFHSEALLNCGQVVLW
jgi:hypothetical protein